MANVFFYTSLTGDGTIGRLAGGSFATTYHIPDKFSWWTHFALSSNSLFLYNMVNGNGVLCRITETKFSVVWQKQYF
ncbi:MAG TPA: hypothetical protein VIV66_18300 [Pyrinomonadaceae bacterium]